MKPVPDAKEMSILCNFFLKSLAEKCKKMGYSPVTVMLSVLVNSIFLFIDTALKQNVPITATPSFRNLLIDLVKKVDALPVPDDLPEMMKKEDELRRKLGYDK